MKIPGKFKSAKKIVSSLKHEFIHVLIGVAYAWSLREVWGQFEVRQIVWAVFGSLLPDVDHFIFFFFYGRNDPYSLGVKKFLRERNLAQLSSFMLTGHKQNTNLWSHNLYTTLILVSLAFLSSLLDWKLGVVLFGSMFLHFVFDILDDLLVLHSLNPNWKRWGRQKKVEQGLQ